MTETTYNMTENNILLQAFNTPYNAVPFDQIATADYQPAILTLIQESKAAIDTIVNDTAAPTFDNIILPLENNTKRLGVATSTFFNLNSAETNEQIEQIAQEISPVLASFSNDILLNEGLFKKVKAVYDTTDRSALTAEQIMLLDKTYKSFVRNGALLNAEQQERLRAIDQELAITGVKFSQNVLQETNAYTLHITDEADLAGLPESIKAMAKAEAAGRSQEGWIFTLQYPSITPFLKYAENRTLRQEIYMANATKALKENEYNNTANIQTIVNLRHERAQLLGFEHHAAFVLEERMAKDAPTVNAFLSDLLAKATPFAHKEIAQIKAVAAVDGITEMMGYDHSFYAEKLRKQAYDFDEETLKPYFSLDQVERAAFDVAKQLYNLTFELRTDIPVYHEEVKVYDVKDGDQHIALLYTDYFPRKGKRPGAWMTSYVGQYKMDGTEQRPHISMVCNFSKPVGDTPSLLTFMEVTTLFHEFGHALHGILANTTFETLSGTNVSWDFVELPSQFMENYCYEASFLQEYAKHYETGETLPQVYIDKIIASANFLQGYQTLRQLGFGILDMAYHSGQYKGEAIVNFEQEQIAATSLYPTIAGTAISPSFSHIFAGGYAAGYYSYKWAEVLDADAFAYFKERGLFDVATAAKFKTLLSSGGTVEAMALYEAFRGRKPDNTALLTRAGLL